MGNNSKKLGHQIWQSKEHKYGSQENAQSHKRCRCSAFEIVSRAIKKHIRWHHYHISQTADVYNSINYFCAFLTRLRAIRKSEHPIPHHWGASMDAHVATVLIAFLSSAMRLFTIALVSWFQDFFRLHSGCPSICWYSQEHNFQQAAAVMANVVVGGTTRMTGACWRSLFTTWHDVKGIDLFNDLVTKSIVNCLAPSW